MAVQLYAAGNGTPNYTVTSSEGSHVFDAGIVADTGNTFLGDYHTTARVTGRFRNVATAGAVLSCEGSNNNGADSVELGPGQGSQWTAFDVTLVGPTGAAPPATLDGFQIRVEVLTSGGEVHVHSFSVTAESVPTA